MPFMSFRFPRNDSKYFWTNHIVAKMRYYGISEQMVRKIIHRPERKEEGIAPKTTAVMSSVESKRKPHEIWVMYQQVKSKLKTAYSAETGLAAKAGQNSKLILISAWRYPGRSPAGKKIDIPEDVLADLQKFFRD